MPDPYISLIIGGLLIALSYAFNLASKRFKVPSVIFLILTGIIIKFAADNFNFGFGDNLLYTLKLLGIVGLIMIVLEAAIDLEISKDKLKVIKKSFFLALAILVITSFGTAFIIMAFLNESFFKSLVYAIPMCVVSSAVVIPSVHALAKDKMEFIIYEATFSDIIGILFFNLVVLQSGNVFSVDGLSVLISTIVLSIALSYLLVIIFSKFRKGIKIFLMFAFLLILYSLGELLHLSSLLMVLVFGLVLNNPRIFFFGKLSKLLDFDSLKKVSYEFKLITAETSFLVRTFFFVVFGMSINLAAITDIRVAATGISIILILYLVRFLNFKAFTKTGVFPEVFLSPRGLITIVLFYAIPIEYQIKDFSTGILFFVIITTSIIMMLALMITPGVKGEELTLVDIGLSPSGDYLETSDNDVGDK